jgi:folate-binding protein YgfZ
MPAAKNRRTCRLNVFTLFAPTANGRRGPPRIAGRWRCRIAHPTSLLQSLEQTRDALPFARDFWQGFIMKAALLPDRGVVKVAGDDAEKFLNGLVTTDVGTGTPARAVFAALLTPQGKIIADFIVARIPPADGAGFLLDCPRALAGHLMERLTLYKLRAKVTLEDMSGSLGVLAAWDGDGTTEYGLVYRDPRLPALGLRVMLPPNLAAEAAAELGAALADARDYEAHRIALGAPRGGVDFIYGDAFPHETDMDQLGGVDFAKGCYVGQEVVSRMEHRGTARTRIIPVAYEGFAPEPGTAVTAGDKPLGTLGSTANGRGIALLRIDRVADALGAGIALTAGTTELRLVKPDWVTFAWPGDVKAAE